MIFQFIEKYKKEHCVEKMAKILNATRSGYYSWENSPESSTKIRHKMLQEEITKIHYESRGTYGSPRVHKVMMNKNIACGINTVAKIMKNSDLRAKAKKKYKATTDSMHKNPLFKNILDRQFNVEQPNKVWVSDITFIHTREGWLYLCIIMDLFSRKIIGYSTSKKIDTNLLMNAFMMAYITRKPGKGIIFHSDRGVQYTSALFQKELNKHGIKCSMSRKGNCWDNACAESFFHTLKVEEVNHKKYFSREEAHNSIFEYIEIFYNRKRIHSSLGYLSPEEYEIKLA